jgi:hypothetical protein
VPLRKESLLRAATDEQRRCRPKDRPSPLPILGSLLSSFVYLFSLNAAVGIYEMASREPIPFRKADFGTSKTGIYNF